MAKNDANETARAAGYLADKNKRIADKCEALGMDEHAADARRRQEIMIEPLHQEAIVTNEIHDLRNR